MKDRPHTLFIGGTKQDRTEVELQAIPLKEKLLPVIKCYFFLIYLLNEKNDIENTKKYNKTIEYRYNGM